MITFKRVQLIGRQVCLEEICEAFLKSRNVFEGVTVLIVRSHITTPKDDIGVHLSIDEFSHFGHYIDRDIASEGSKRTSLD